MTDINFLPQSFRQRQARRRRIVRETVLVILATAVLLAAGSVRQRRLSERAGYVQEKQAEAAAVAQQVQERARLTGELARLHEQQALQQRLSMPLTYTNVLAALAQIMPTSIALTDLTMDCPAPAPTRQTKASARSEVSTPNKKAAAPTEPLRELSLKMTGLGPSDVEVANFVGRLSDHQLFRDVKLSYTRETRVNGVVARQFRLEMTVPLEQVAAPAAAGGLAHAH